MRDGEALRCLDPVGISSLEWYKMPLWIKLDTKTPIMSYRTDLDQSREG